MSHWTKAKTKLTEQSFIEKALTRMGFEFETGEFSISAEGTTEMAEIKLHNNVGMQKQEDGTWAMVGDPYYIQKGGRNGRLRDFYRKTDAFTEELSTAYTVEQVSETLEDQNFQCMENEAGDVGEDGLITMVFERW